MKFLWLITCFNILIWSITVKAVIPEIHPTDQFEIGKPSTSNLKQLLFNWNLGIGSNPYLGVDSSYNLNYNYNTFNMGDGTNSTQKSFIANIGNGASNPQIIWNQSLNQWQFTNDGSLYLAIAGVTSGITTANLTSSNITVVSGNTSTFFNVNVASGDTFTVNSGGDLVTGKAIVAGTLIIAGSAISLF